MFKELQDFRNNYSGTPQAYDEFILDPNNPVFIFFKNLDSFAFYPELKRAFTKKYSKTLEEAHLNREYVSILNVLLDKDGLNYAESPKGLLRFHAYEGSTRTPAEEQIMEGWSHKAGEKLEIHFTVLPDHLSDFKEHVEQILLKLNFGSSVEATFSTQKKSTDIIAVDHANDPFRDTSGSLLFRPAGHGTLLENLADLDADLVFIKNIDNILPDHLRTTSVRWKKLLAGLLIEFQGKIFDLLERAQKGEDILAEALELLPQLGVSGVQSEKEIFQFLNRPIRVCGMVKNEGEPGGGPFWTNSGGKETLQIVESAQIDSSNQEQQDILKSSTLLQPC